MCHQNIALKPWWHEVARISGLFSYMGCTRKSQVCALVPTRRTNRRQKRFFPATRVRTAKHEPFSEISPFLLSVIQYFAPAALLMHELEGAGCYYNRGVARERAALFLF